MAPGAVYEQTRYQKDSYKEQSGQPHVGGFEYFKWIDGIDNVGTPRESDNRKNHQEKKTDAVRNCEGHFNLFSKNGVSLIGLIQTKDQILKNADLATPRTNVFIGNEYDQQKYT